MTENGNTNISSAPVIIPKKIEIRNQKLSCLINTTTVFVGNISEACSDNLIRHLLQVVGKVVNWRRVQGANAKLESFGFVEYGDPEDALRALRLINNLQVGDKKLITKVDEKTRVNLVRFEQEQREFVKSRLKPGESSVSETIQKSRMVEDEKIVKELMNLLQGHIVFNKHTYNESPRNSDFDINKASQDDPRRDSKTQLGSSDSIYRDRNRRNRSRTPEEEQIEKRRQERRKQHKEEQYQNRLKRWLTYEKNLITELEKCKSREKRKKLDLQEKRNKAIELLDNYNDDTDDIKQYLGSAWEKKLKDRENEIDGEERDKKREEEETKIIKKTQQISSSELESDESIEPEIVRPQSASSGENQERNTISTGVNLKEGEEENLVKRGAAFERNFSKPIEFGIKRKPQTPPKTISNTGIEEIFVPDEEEVLEQPVMKKIRLTTIDEKTKMSAPIEYGPESAKYLTPAERNKKKKKIIEKIPTDKTAIFSYDVKWFIVDQQFMEKYINSWVKKQIIEYLGEEEQTLIDYILKKILEKCTPESLMKNISMILDEEAEVFIIKLWRLLIYETEAKSLGLSQD